MHPERNTNIRIEIELLIELIFVSYFFYSFYASSFRLGLRFSLSSFLSCFPVEAFPQRLGIKYFIFFVTRRFRFSTPSIYHTYEHPRVTATSTQPTNHDTIHTLITLSLRFGFAIGSTETILNSGSKYVEIKCKTIREN